MNYSLQKLFEEIFEDLRCESDTKSYIIGIFEKYKSAQYDLSKHSLTLMFAQARENNSFAIYQNLGDWIFFHNSLLANTEFRDKAYYDNLAQISYYRCYRIINRQWVLFEELSDNLPVLEAEVRKRIRGLSS